MMKAKQILDPEREKPITMEIVVDAYDARERAMGWYYYLQDRLRFPFTAICIDKRSISPLHVKDEVEAIGLSGEEECEHEMFVTIRWEKEGLAVPLSQLKPITRPTSRRSKRLRIGTIGSRWTTSFNRCKHLAKICSGPFHSVAPAEAGW
jgi:hypothetical protein